MTRPGPRRCGAAGLALLAALAAAGCAPLAPGGCAGRVVACPAAETGPTRAPVRIDTAPTPAAIYLDGRFIGYSPMTYPVTYTSATSHISVVAVPLYPGQAQQQRLIRVPPLPKRVSFFMNNPPSRESDDIAVGMPIPRTEP
jgi:hypothetical protein